jgi:putative PEP-CTERM system histidine kinase
MEYQSVTFLAYLGASVVSILLTLAYCFQYFSKQNTWVLAGAAAIHSLNLFLIAMNYYGNVSPSLLYSIEYLHFNAWIFFIGLFIKRDLASNNMPKSLHILFYGGWSITILGIVLTYIQFPFEQIFIWLALALSINALVSVEQLYRYAAENDRQIKLLCMNLLAIFLFDIYLYTHALIFNGIDPLLWQSRAAISITTCLLMTLGSLLLFQQKDRPARLTISRPIALYTTSLILAGFIVTFLSLGGYYVKLYGGNWGTIFYTFVLAIAVILIATVFISSQIRAQLSVLINKHLFRYKYDYRSEWLRLINYLAEPASAGDINQRAFFAVASVTKAPSGAIWLLKQGFYEPVYRANLPNFVELQEEPVNSPFCRAFIESDWVFIPDSNDDHAHSQHNEVLPHWTKNIPDLWLIFPLIVAEELIGFIALTKPANNESLTWEDLDLLKTIGRQIASYLKRHHQEEQLAERKQFDTYNKLVAFIVHDLNNLMAQQALLIRNAERHKDNPAFVDDMINTISHSVTRMSNLLKKLRRDDEPDSITLVPIDEVMTNALEECVQGKPTITTDIEKTARIVIGDPVRLVMTIAHFLKNAQEATPENGKVHVTLRVIDDRVQISVEDNGSGMDWDFIHNRLFKPFETTKSGKGMGIGAYLSREYISELGGTLNVVSEPSQGTIVTMSLPLLQE